MLRTIAKPEVSLTDLYFLAEAEQSEFADLEIITTEQYRYDQAVELAFSRGSTIDSIMEDAGTLFQTIPHCEFVEVFPSKIRVVINADRVDDDVIQQAITMLTHIEEFVEGKRMTFDELRTERLNKKS